MSYTDVSWRSRRANTFIRYSLRVCFRYLGYISVKISQISLPLRSFMDELQANYGWMKLLNNNIQKCAMIHCIDPRVANCPEEQKQFRNNSPLGGMMPLISHHHRGCVLHGYQAFLQLLWEWLVGMWSKRMSGSFEEMGFIPMQVSHSPNHFIGPHPRRQRGGKHGAWRLSELSQTSRCVSAAFLDLLSSGTVCLLHQEICQHSQLEHKQTSRFWLIQIGTIQTVTKRDLFPWRNLHVKRD